jgi:hypothetical protein
MVIDAVTVTILDDGEIGFKGTYTVFRDTLEVSDGVDEVTARWSFDGKQLRFTEVIPENTPSKWCGSRMPGRRSGSSSQAWGGGERVQVDGLTTSPLFEDSDAPWAFSTATHQ